MAITVRLPKILEGKLNAVSEMEGKTKSEIIKESLNLYFTRYNVEKTPFELGKDMFGKYQSGFKDRSINTQREISLKIKAKQNAKKPH